MLTDLTFEGTKSQRVERGESFHGFFAVLIHQAFLTFSWTVYCSRKGQLLIDSYETDVFGMMMPLNVLYDITL